MGMLDEIIAQLKNPGEDGLSETIYDDLTQTYADESGGWVAKVAEIEAGSIAKDGEISRLKSLLFDKSMETPSNSETEPDDSGSDDEDDSDESYGIDALFQPKGSN